MGTHSNKREQNVKKKEIWIVVTALKSTICFTRCGFMYKYKACSHIYHIILMFFFLQITPNNTSMQLHISAQYFQCFSCFTATDKSSSCVKHSSESVSSWLVVIRHQKTTAAWKRKSCQQKGSSLSTCCGTGCYKHSSHFKWVHSVVMFPSKCYLLSPGTVPCTRGAKRTSCNTCTLSPTHTHRHTRPQSWARMYTNR